MTLKDSAFDFPGSEDWWHLSAGHAFFRCGIVSLVLFLFYLARNLVERAGISQFLILCGQESLFIYVFHLMLVYGTVSNFGLQSLALHLWGSGQTALVFVVVTAMSYTLASMWHQYKKVEPRRASRAIFTIMIAFIIIFAMVPSYLADR